MTLETLKTLIVCFVLLATAASIMPLAYADIPPAALKTPPMVKEQSVSTFVPSEAAPGQGIAVNLIYSTRPRYKEGAPVVVVVPGGNHNHGLDSSIHAAQQGFIELRFAFPGGGKPGFASSGIYDNRGAKSQEALRDVMKFAAGVIDDYQGKKISDLLPVTVYNKTIGTIGWSNGGNILIVTLAKHASELPFVSWMALYESPVGSLFFPPNLGGAEDRMLNKHYRAGTAATGQPLVDWTKLRYDGTGIKHPGSHKKLGEPEIKGVVFFDENGNNAWDETGEFALTYSTDVGFDKQIYPPAATKNLLRLPEFQQPKPDKSKPKEKPAPVAIPFASMEESQGYFHDRDGSLHVKELVAAYPTMAFTLFGSHLDHLQRQPDHPHIALLYNALLEAKAKFLRLNPSSIYVAHVSNMKASTFAENKPGSSIESDAIDQCLEPEGLIPDYAYMEAAAAELSDRVYVGKWNKILAAPLVNYSNGASPPPETKPSATTDTGSKAGSSSTSPTGSSSSVKPTKSAEPSRSTKPPKKEPAIPASPGPGGFSWPTAEKDAVRERKKP